MCYRGNLFLIRFNHLTIIYYSRVECTLEVTIIEVNLKCDKDFCTYEYIMRHELMNIEITTASKP